MNTILDNRIVCSIKSKGGKEMRNNITILKELIKMLINGLKEIDINNLY
jgi:hypothetical protein